MAVRNNEKREQILRVSYQLFGEEAYSKATLAEIAKGAGINKSLLQSYYPQKIEIIRAMLTDILNSSFTYMQKESDADIDIMQQISDFNMLFFKAVANNYHLERFITVSVAEPQILDVWVEIICSWLRHICGENTFTYQQLRIALCFSMGGSMHLFQHKDELGIDYRYFTENHIRAILRLLNYSQEEIDRICCNTVGRISKMNTDAFLQYWSEQIEWFDV